MAELSSIDVADVAIKNIFGSNTPIGDVQKPKVYTPRVIEYVQPEILTGSQKDRSNEIRKEQMSDAKVAIDALDEYSATGQFSATLRGLGATEEGLSKPIIKQVPTYVIYGFMNRIDKSSDWDEIARSVTKFTESNIEYGEVVSEKDQHIIDVILATK
ncbi:MAG: hypothetical protein K0B07_05395 [DPANN group archaeon]|nr:hypothetical protein [DPANN group archaeon]